MDNGTSLASSIYGYTYENGRRYHAYRQGSYLLPNDAEEQDRLDMLHHIFRLQLGGSLHLAPLSRDCKRALDIGTGTGIWAIDFADEYAETKVVGTDLSPIQPAWTPPNCHFFVDDVEAEWTYRAEEAFDYIHSRGMGGAIADWPLLTKRCFNNLNPGGWFEIQDYDPVIVAFDGDGNEVAPQVMEWVNRIMEASNLFGKTMNVTGNASRWLTDAGFEDVHEKVFQVPIGPWAKDKTLKEIGAFQREVMVSSVATYGLATLTRVLGWKMEEAQVLMAGARKELRDPKLRLLCTWRYVYGRKPLGPDNAVDNAARSST